MRNLALSLFLGSLLFCLTGCLDEVGLASVGSAKSLGRIMFPRFIATGVHSTDASAITGQLDSKPTDNWTAVWSGYAADYAERSAGTMESGQIDNGKYLLLKAAVYYRVAGYPYPLDEGRKAAYRKSAELFRQYIKFVDPQPETINFSLETKRAVGYLRIPSGARRFPAAIILPGLDSVKEEMYWLENIFLEKGFVTLTIDSPGTGDNEWPLRADSQRLLNRVVEYAQAHNSIDPEKIALVGFDFGGYWALRTAAHKRISAVAVVNAPVHYAFEGNRVGQYPRFFYNMLRQACGAGDHQELYKTMNSLSLKDSLSKIDAAVLAIYPGKAMLLPDEEKNLLLSELKIPVSIKTYPQEKYGLITNLQSEVYPLLTDWLERTLR